MDAPSLFAGLNLPPRPPTPPKEPHDEKAICDAALAMLSSNILSHSLDTPNESPNSCNESFTRSSERGAKHVKFIPTPSNIEDLENIGSTPASEKDLAGRRPIRSILKRSGSLLSSDPLSSDPAAPPDPTDDRDFPAMLEDMMKGLSSPDISARYDAYMIINRCLKSYKDVPSRQSLVEKLPTLMECIQADLAETKPVSGPRASQLVTEAVRLVTILACSEPTKSAMSPGFQSFILNHAVSAIVSKETSKHMLNLYLYLLSQQDFGAKIMTKERANRLLSGLQAVEEHVKSKSASAHKLMIYQKMLRQDQARLIMITRADEWMSHLFTYLFSSVKEIRARAIDFGLRAGYTIGTERHISRAFRDLMTRKHTVEGTEKSYVETLVDRLTAWAESKEHCMHVPQIWSIGVLFLRNKDRPFDKWKSAPLWLRVLQKGFNSSDPKLRSQANQVWTRFIYAVSPDQDTPNSTSSLLLSPLESQMRRSSGSTKEAREVRRVTYAAYCSLLYYALRPDADYETLERYWNVYVGPILSPGKSERCVDPDMTCRILSSLLNGSRNQIWDSERICKGPMQKPEEIHCLDARWIRSRASLVFKLLESLNCEESWIDGEREYLFLHLWKHATNAIGQASQREVKVSSLETMTALAEVVTSLNRFFEKSEAEDDKRIFDKFILLIRAAVESISLRPFLEKRLVYSIEKRFTVLDTPSLRSSKASHSPKSGLTHLLNILLSTNINADQGQYEQALNTLLNIALESATSTVSSIILIREFAENLDSAPSASQGPFWEVIANTLQSVLESSEAHAAANGFQDSSQVYREACKILTLAPWQVLANESRSWCSAFDELNGQILSAHRVVGSSLYFVEPLARHLRENLGLSESQSWIEPAIKVVSAIQWPNSPHNTKQVRRKYPGNSSHPRDNLASPNEVYSLVSALLGAAYSSSTTTVELKLLALSTVRKVFEQCPSEFVDGLLNQSYFGLAVWTTDADAILTTKDLGSQRLFRAVVELWDTVLKLVAKLKRFDTALLTNLATPLSFGFTSKHRAILNSSVMAWNATFGLSRHLEYPKELRAVLFRLSFVTDLQLPGLSVRESDSQVDSTPLEFADTPEDLKHLTKQDQAPENRPYLAMPTAEISNKSTSAAAFITSVKTPELSPGAKRTKALERATPRLRHDNSQIEFAAIDSSPSILGAIDSQLLTDRQKEVRERQSREAAAIFPDLRSSPKPSSSARKQMTPRLQLSQRDLVEASGGRKEPISPTLPPTNNMTPFLGSSPTPSQRSTSSKGKYLVKPTTDSPQRPEIRLTGLAQDIPSSPPSVIAKKAPEMPSFEQRVVTAQQEMSDIEEGLVEAGNEPAERFKEVADVLRVNTFQDNEDFPGSCNDKDPRQIVEEYADIEMREAPDDVIAEANINSLPHPDPNAEGSPQLIGGAERELLSDDVLTHNKFEDHELNIEEALDYSSDQNDLVSSQIAREIESASQDTIVYPSPQAMDPTPPSAVRGAKKKRGRSKRKREEDVSTSSQMEEEEILDTITVAQPNSSPVHAAMSEPQLDGNDSTRGGMDEDAQRPSKRSRQSSKEQRASASQPLPETKHRSQSTRRAHSSSDTERYEQREENAIESLQRLATSLRRGLPPLSYEPGNIQPRLSANTDQGEQEKGSVQGSTGHGASSPAEGEAGADDQPAGIAARLEALVDEVQGEIPAEETEPVMRLSLQLLEMVRKSMGPSKKGRH